MIKIQTFSNRLQAVESHRPQKGKLLDVGCAEGLLVKTALARGWDAYGIDISEFAIDEARQSLGDRVCVGILESSPFLQGTFDAIFLSDMIEHVHDPQSVLTHVTELLKDQGHLFIETPNVSGMLRKLMGHRWPHYHVPEHLVYFSPKNLEDLLKRNGFETVHWQASWKALTWNYVMDKLAVNHPRMIRLIKPFGVWFGDRNLWIPAGSFWSISVKSG
ncbi:MAG: class I SAM-dependent methyltransferase [SAR324 cluster bacterium]|nr:class I SAM-dependent methyltransferase [SAR324 cluster bacterium]